MLVIRRNCRLVSVPAFVLSIIETERNVPTSNRRQVSKASLEEGLVDIVRFMIDSSFFRNQPYPSKPRRRAAEKSWLAAALVLAVCLSLLACSGSDAKQQQAQAAAPHAVSVAVAPVLKQDMKNCGLPSNQNRSGILPRNFVPG